MIAYQGKKPFFGVVQGNGEHAVEAAGEIAPPLFIGMYDDFRVRLGAEAVAIALQFPFQLGEVVDFPVKHGPDAAVFIIDGLITASQINNRQTAHAHADSCAGAHTG